MIGACGPLGADAALRLSRAMAMVGSPEPIDADEVAGRIEALLAAIDPEGG